MYLSIRIPARKLNGAPVSKPPNHCAYATAPQPPTRPTAIMARNTHARKSAAAVLISSGGRRIVRRDDSVGDAVHRERGQRSRQGDEATAIVLRHLDVVAHHAGL